MPPAPPVTRIVLLIARAPQLNILRRRYHWRLSRVKLLHGLDNHDELPLNLNVGEFQTRITASREDTRADCIQWPFVYI